MANILDDIGHKHSTKLKMLNYMHMENRTDNL